MLPKKFTRPLLAISGSLLIASCATSQNPNDPYEHYNRDVFTFNMAVDHYVLRPVAVGYTYIPEPIRYAVSNFYNNLHDFVSLANDILQLDGTDTMQTTMRIAINSTFGLLGLIDVSSSLGLPQYTNTFGNTMKTWGWQDSNYFLVPFLGPATFRDQLGIIPDVYFNPLFWIINDPWISYSIFAINLIDLRSQYLGQDKLLTQTLDPYATIRDVYLQRKGAYKYPSESQGSESESLDSLIDEENGIPSKPSSNSSTNLDNIIDEENAALTMTPVALKASQSANSSANKIAPATFSTKQLIIESSPTVAKPVTETESAV
jgi:phospholipid-binding lipoprotein MlaA